MCQSHDDEAEGFPPLSAHGSQEAYLSLSIHKALYLIMASISFRDNYGGFQLGKNEGHIEFNPPPGKSGTGHDRKFAYSWPLPTPERPETPPSPLSTVPFARDCNFVSRDLLLRQIREKSSVPGSRIALVGLGGVG